VAAITVETTISKPREEVFEYLADIANHAEFLDHYLVNWHLLREDPYGRGAGARFRIRAPLNRFSWGDFTLTEVTAPHRIVEKGRGGKYNRIRMVGTYTLSQAPAGTTRVQYSFETEPPLFSDRLMESLGGSFWARRQLAKAIRRLRTILEEGRGRGRRPTVAAG
jgi:uncharacterized protein YndB with AHSA1/START domain